MNNDDHKTITQLLNGEGNPADCFFDWFCRDSSLKNKAAALLKRVRAISRSKKFDNDKCYLLFKNNCPASGNLFDDFRICDIETGDVIYTVIPSSGFRCNKGNALVYGNENNFRGPILEGTWSEIKAWFLN